MAKINKKIIVPSVMLLVILLASIYGANQVFAEDDLLYPRVITKIAQKFNLKEADVAEVFEQDRIEKWQERQKQRLEKLNQAVSDGVITVEQKNRLLDKMDEWQADRSAQKQEHREEMQDWMAENGIDHEKLRVYLGVGGMGEHKGKGYRLSR